MQARSSGNWIFPLYFVPIYRREVQMSVHSEILNAISRYSYTQIFTTREMLHLGSRESVDKALSRLVEWKCIERISPGVFRKFKYKNKPASPTQVAAVKAASFGRSIATMGSIEEQKNIPRLKVRTKSNRDLPQIFFAIKGRTSSFVFGKIRIVLKGVASRKLALGESYFGRILRLAWLDGIQNSEKLSRFLFVVAPPLTHQESTHSSRFPPFLPWWINELWQDFLAWQSYGLLKSS